MYIPLYSFDYESTECKCLPHTPPEGLSGSGKFKRLMTFIQLFFGISGTQNRKNQNFLTSPFFVIAILRYLTFPYCFYYIAILSQVIFGKFLQDSLWFLNGYTQTYEIFWDCNLHLWASAGEEIFGIHCPILPLEVAKM